ncbi:reticulon-like protein B3 [Carya illinoinensis]|uniref:Reticulon-like protein n=1 Tax=Carya illinoinensis TaxID=32201 RepID=A0A8T1QPC1_CARIL|nr:reticulon-like protein B3 [Carya illinoinensis]KAG6656053.1 hypothetical protein CIPAW_05G260300 [Carya illinoinensis]
MADHAGEPESLLEKITRHDDDLSSSSDSDSDDNSKPFEASKSKIFRLFGREQPIHKVFGGGKSADVVLWRNKKISAVVLCGATVLWVLFELLEYHLVTLVCHMIILYLTILFFWSNAPTFIKKSPLRIPEVRLPENCVLEVASAVRIEINRALAVLRDIASGRNLKTFLGVVAGLWILSRVGKWCNFLTSFYIGFILLHTLPVLYEKYEDQVDSFAEMTMAEINKQYAVFDAKVLSKIPMPLKDKKKD